MIRKGLRHLVSAEIKTLKFGDGLSWRFSAGVGMVLTCDTAVDRNVFMTQISLGGKQVDSHQCMRNLVGRPLSVGGCYLPGLEN